MWSLSADISFSESLSKGWAGGQWDSLGTGGPLHAALPESCPKHWQLEGSLVPLCSLCAWWAALQGTGGLEEQTGLAWLPGPKASSWGRPDLNNPLATRDCHSTHTAGSKNGNGPRAFWSFYLLEELIIERQTALELASNRKASPLIQSVVLI